MNDIQYTEVIYRYASYSMLRCPSEAGDFTFAIVYATGVVPRSPGGELRAAGSSRALRTDRRGFQADNTAVREEEKLPGALFVHLSSFFLS